MPIFVQSFMGHDQRSAGMIMFVGAVGMGLASQFSGRLSDKYGFRIFTFVGIGMMIATNIAFSMFVADTSLWVVMPTLFLNGVGMGLWMAPNMSATLSTIGKGDLGSMSAFLNLVRNVGSVLGQAMAIAVIAGVMLSRGTEVGLGELEDAGEKVSQAFLAGWSMTFWILAGVSAVALFAATRTRVYNDTPESPKPPVTE